MSFAWAGSGPRRSSPTLADCIGPIGQIERGEKNVSFANLVKISGVLGVTLSELLSGLETDGGRDKELAHRKDSGDRRSARFAVETDKLLRRFKFQRAAMDRTMTLLEEAIIPISSRNAVKKRRARK
jgi:transcriptional regulator with XRE-family HTH domain